MYIYVAIASDRKCKHINELDSPLTRNLILNDRVVRGYETQISFTVACTM